MRCAIYARKSTDNQELSTQIQVQEAKAYIERKGWTLAKDHIYIDDAVSRAEFAKRDGLIRLLNNASEFQVLVVRDETRLGGEMYRTGALIQDLLDSDVRIFFYYSDEEITLDNSTQKIIMAVRNFASELEREKISQRVHENHMVKARQGYVVGGKTFGYDNVDVLSDERDKSGKRKRLHVSHEINEKEAEIIRLIFRLYAEGKGLINIAKTLNRKGIPAIRSKTWSHSSIRQMLKNETYIGVKTWNKTKKVYRKGTKDRDERPENEWLRVEVPELRIISQDLWDRVQDRFKEAERAYLRSPNGTLLGRPDSHRSSRYLLSGLGSCSECGGAIAVQTTTYRGRHYHYYGCSQHRQKGNKVCKNNLRLRIDAINKAVIEDLTERILTPEVVELAIEETMQLIKSQLQEDPARMKSLEKEKAKLEREIENLVNAIAAGSAPDAIVKALKDKEKKVKSLEVEISRLESVDNEVDFDKIRPMVVKALDYFKKILLDNQQKARQGIKKLLSGKIEFEPVNNNGNRHYNLSGKWSFDPVLINIPLSPHGQKQNWM
jgi:DNA invertase Pin-like site-specific DNA recombinase